MTPPLAQTSHRGEPLEPRNCMGNFQMGRGELASRNLDYIMHFCDQFPLPCDFAIQEDSNFVQDHTGQVKRMYDLWHLLLFCQKDSEAMRVAHSALKHVEDTGKSARFFEAAPEHVIGDYTKSCATVGRQWKSHLFFWPRWTARIHRILNLGGEPQEEENCRHIRGLQGGPAGRRFARIR